ncbi:hypothetical protein SLEP1_g45674 [Rubroshorea leprosula]|uniref:Uncharacterized protein n=1 Tax=Rubroshorea leprosula TaxID=152421 RepID=A0AAV5LK34_9ROSI|nr:hypothetical protein SLEP1_g45674 [Rubroshorea leprosula]
MKQPAMRRGRPTRHAINMHVQKKRSRDLVGAASKGRGAVEPQLNDLKGDGRLQPAFLQQQQQRQRRGQQRQRQRQQCGNSDHWASFLCGPLGF